jgi:hypothetical protein
MVDDKAERSLAQDGPTGARAYYITEGVINCCGIRRFAHFNHSPHYMFRSSIWQSHE